MADSGDSPGRGRRRRATRPLDSLHRAGREQRHARCERRPPRTDRRRRRPSRLPHGRCWSGARRGRAARRAHQRGCRRPARSARARGPRRPTGALAAADAVVDLPSTGGSGLDPVRPLQPRAQRQRRRDEARPQGPVAGGVPRRRVPAAGRDRGGVPRSAATADTASRNGTLARRRRVPARVLGTEDDDLDPVAARSAARLGRPRPEPGPGRGVPAARDHPREAATAAPDPQAEPLGDSARAAVPARALAGQRGRVAT